MGHSENCTMKIGLLILQYFFDLFFETAEVTNHFLSLSIKREKLMPFEIFYAPGIENA